MKPDTAHNLVAAPVDVLSCAGCGGTIVSAVEVPFPLFRHLDFKTVSAGPATLGRCADCGIVLRIADAEELAAIDAIYRSDEYASYRQSHAILVEGDAEPVSMPSLQARLLARHLPGGAARVLDIGCLDGALLRALAGWWTHAEFVGFDVSPRPAFPVGPRLRFIVGGLDTVSGQFDLVVLSHSIQYARDLGVLLARVKTLLAADGVVFVQVPDLTRRPCAILFGDVHQHFTAAALASVLARAGLASEAVETEWFPRDVALLARPVGVPVKEARAADEGAIAACLHYVTEMARALDVLPSGESIGVLGTTIEAAFIDEQLNARLRYFVDENPEKVGTTFRGKRVMHPRSVGAYDVIVLPMGSRGEPVRARLTSRHPGVYVCV